MFCVWHDNINQSNGAGVTKKLVLGSCEVGAFICRPTNAVGIRNILFYAIFRLTHRCAKTVDIMNTQALGSLQDKGISVIRFLRHIALHCSYGK